MTDEIEEKQIVITVTGHDYMHPDIEVTGAFNGSQMRRVLAATAKHIRLEATKKHYAQLYAEEAREQAALAEEAETPDIEETEGELDEDLPEQESGDAEEQGEEPTKDDNDLSYLSDSTNESKQEE